MSQEQQLMAYVTVFQPAFALLAFIFVVGITAVLVDDYRRSKTSQNI
ncbi:MAG: hypothetical protein ABIR46_03035 [Candidatus Saccharimonadales bacterium]